MLNQTVLVGRLVNEPTLENNEDKRYSEITIAVTRSFKNMNGEYDTDLIPIMLWEGIAVNTAEYLHKGDLIGIKGRLQVKEDKVAVVAEKVTFLSSKKED